MSLWYPQEISYMKKNKTLQDASKISTRYCQNVSKRSLLWTRADRNSPWKLCQNTQNKNKIAPTFHTELGWQSSQSWHMKDIGHTHIFWKTKLVHTTGLFSWLKGVEVRSGKKSMSMKSSLFFDNIKRNPETLKSHWLCQRLFYKHCDFLFY